MTVKMCRKIIVLILFSLFLSIAIAQSEEVQGLSYGSVISISSEKMVIKEAHTNLNVAYDIDIKNMGLQNVNSLGDIRAGDWVNILYIIKDERRRATLISLEKTPPAVKRKEPKRLESFEALRSDARASVCKAYAAKINVALMSYFQWHAMNFNQGKDNPASLHETEFIKNFMKGDLPEHPAGQDWDNFYDPESGKVDVNKACNF